MLLAAIVLRPTDVPRDSPPGQTSHRRRAPRPPKRQPSAPTLVSGGAGEIRTPDLRRAKAALSQLSYGPLLVARRDRTTAYNASSKLGDRSALATAHFLLAAIVLRLTTLLRDSAVGQTWRPLTSCSPRSSSGLRPIFELLAWSELARRPPASDAEAAVLGPHASGWVVGHGGLEPPASVLSGPRSNQLS